MEPIEGAVKPRRGYDSTGRRDQARRTREAIVRAAKQLFLRDGYGSTTIASIAGEAGVSVETIYKAFGGKPGLVRAIVERGLSGVGPVPAPERSDLMRQAEGDPRRIITAWGTFTTEVAPLVAPILLLVRDAAATDPDMAALQEEVNAQRLERMTDNARHLHEAGHLRPGITHEIASDVLWTYSSPELYELLVLRRGWSVDRYGRFLGEAMIAALIR